MVISQSDSAPVYPDNGYMSPAIDDRTETSRLVINPLVYNDGDFNSILECGVPYYFSVTTRYHYHTPDKGHVYENIPAMNGSVQVIYDGPDCPADTGVLKMCKQNDLNGDGILDNGEPTVHGWDFIVDDETIYNDVDDSVLDGCATIDLPYGTYNIDEVMQPGWSQTGASGNGTYNPGDGSVDINIDGPGAFIVYFLNEQDQDEPEECPDQDNLIINYSFEEPVVTNASLWQKMSPVFGWAIEKVSDSSATTLELHKGWSGNVAANGWQYAELDGDHSTRISQDVVTEEGAEYKLFWSFAPRHNITAEQNQLSVEVNGSQVGTNGPATGSAPLAQDDWTNSSYVFIADSTNTEIALEDIGPSNSYGTFVDNVRLCKIADPEHESATVIANKIVCNSEADLPNWSGGADITANTAQDYVDRHSNCHFASDWKFEWGSNTSLLDLDGDYVGEHNASGWYDFDSLTDINGETQVTLNLDELPGRLWFREVLQAGYIPFSFPPGNSPGSDISAEFWCNDDVANYDNAEWIDVSPDNTYYCVAFNVEEESEYGSYCGDGVVDPSWEECDPGISRLMTPIVGCSEQCQFIDGDCNDLVAAKINVDTAWNKPGGNDF
ncbi:hypothetical protein K8R42_04540 [bacterium]|nr:hypothetical protein [bacterium]